MSTRGPTGSIPTRRSTTTVSRPCFESTDSRPVWIDWRPRLDQEGVIMRPRRVLALVVVLLSLGIPLAAQTSGVREVTASDRSVIPLNTKLRYTTMVVLPEDEEILDVICGDRDFWVVSATQNIAHVKPAKEGAATNLNLLTASGAVYSFLLTENKSGQPDLKVYVTADSSAAHTKPKYVSATQVSALQNELSEARAAIETVRHQTDDAVAIFRQQ